jgi:hypothetical protein
MTSQAETVDLLVKKANFQPQVALAVAEAIYSAMTDSQLVTVPILESRLAEQRADTHSCIANLKLDTQARFAEVRSDILRLEKENALTREILSNEIKAARIDFANEIKAARGDFAKDLAVSHANLLKEIGVTNERTKSELVRWVLLAMLGSAAIGVAGSSITNAIEHSR